MSAGYLLDANVLIALTLDEHEHHGRVRGWFTSAGTCAVCPIAEGALVRFFVRAGAGGDVARILMARLYADERFDFWPDSLSYATADLSGVVGHQQVTDAYLVALALSRGALLATLDHALAALRPEATVLIA